MPIDTSQTESNGSYLISCESLKSSLGQENLLIIDTRDALEYNRSHIPSAVNMDEIFTYISEKDTDTYDNLLKTFKDLFSSIGLNKEKNVVFYEDAMDSGYGRSCRGVFLMHFFGYKNSRVLHGGFRAWLAEGFEVDKVVPQVTPSVFIPQPDYSIIVSTGQMLQALDSPEIIKLDVRDHPEWVGASSSPYGVNYCPRKGRIPGSQWIEWYQMLSVRKRIPWFKEPEEILKVCQDAGITPDRTIYLYCFKGARASNTYIALKLAGYRHIKNYFGSWNDWSRDFSLPIEEGYLE